MADDVVKTIVGVGPDDARQGTGDDSCVLRAERRGRIPISVAGKGLWIRPPPILGREPDPETADYLWFSALLPCALVECSLAFSVWPCASVECLWPFA